MFFCFCFFDTKLPWWFCLKKVEKPQKYFLSAAKSIEKFFSWNITFSPQLCQFRRIVLLNFRKRCTTLKKGRHSLATKTNFKKNSTVFEHYIFFTIFCLLSNCITKVCFFCCFLTLNYLDGFARKRKKGLSLSCRKHSYSHLLCAIFFNFVTLHSFIQYFRNFWKKSKNFAFLFPKAAF